jgi:hypothetical protein
MTKKEALDKVKGYLLGELNATCPEEIFGEDFTDSELRKLGEAMNEMQRRLAR